MKKLISIFVFALFIVLSLPVFAQGVYFDIGGGLGYTRLPYDDFYDYESRYETIDFISFSTGFKLGGGPFGNVPLYIVGDTTLFIPTNLFMGAGVIYYPIRVLQFGTSLGPSFYWWTDPSTGFGWYISAAFDFGEGNNGLLLGLEYFGAAYSSLSAMSNHNFHFGVFVKYTHRSKIPSQTLANSVASESRNAGQTYIQIINQTTEDIGDGIVIIRENDEITRLQVTSIIFRADNADFDGLSAGVLQNNETALRRIAEILNSYSDYKVTIEGHSNATTPPGTRERASEETAIRLLSEQRALKIAGELILRGVSLDRINVRGAGISNMLVPYDDWDNNWKNRRVEFILVRQGK